MQRGITLIAKDSFTNVSTVSFDNVFSNTYKQYRIVNNLYGTSNSYANLRLRANGVDNSSLNYNRQYLITQSTSIILSRGTFNQIDFYIDADTNIENISIFEILNPYQSTYTTAVTKSSRNVSSSSLIDLYSASFGTTVTTSYDGFTVFAQSGTITGSISVYGLDQ